LSGTCFAANSLASADRRAATCSDFDFDSAPYATPYSSVSGRTVVYRVCPKKNIASSIYIAIRFQYTWCACKGLAAGQCLVQDPTPATLLASIGLGDAKDSGARVAAGRLNQSQPPVLEAHSARRLRVSQNAVPTLRTDAAVAPGRNQGCWNRISGIRGSRASLRWRPQNMKYRAVYRHFVKVFASGAPPIVVRALLNW